MCKVAVRFSAAIHHTGMALKLHNVRHIIIILHTAQKRVSQSQDAAVFSRSSSYSASTSSLSTPLFCRFLLCRNQIIEGLQDECASKGFPGEIIFPIYFPFLSLSSDNNGQSNAPVLGARSVSVSVSLLINYFVESSAFVVL
jgi:hypothetical protein